MKWLVYLCSLYVLLLSGIPCSADDDCCKGLMEQAIPRDNHNASKEHNPVSPCSPFFACAVHAIVVPETYMVKPVVLPPVAKLHGEYIEPQLHGFFPSIWQPPKQV
ncbi:MAG TPA: hypothetical protein VFS25_24995 [Chitinophaga sp.]|uniref:hypothetical protein n=1 Tax=Chitinophaga sp. TaxID=1869181 RepID=UPI002DBA6B03|nr:hypothetical protein [Chitinophaga sp.]HEU4556129.1 hypothetical protein [Chitinophaga sp.]